MFTYNYPYYMATIAALATITTMASCITQYNISQSLRVFGNVYTCIYVYMYIHVYTYTCTCVDVVRPTCTL